MRALGAWQGGAWGCGKGTGWRAGTAELVFSGAALRGERSNHERPLTANLGDDTIMPMAL